MYKCSKNITDSLTLYYNDIDKDDVEFFETHIKHSASLIQDAWELELKKNCRFYIMDSWFKFLFHSAPWFNKLLYCLLLPLLFFRIKRLWDFCGGWTMLFWSRPAVGIKPKRLLKYIKNKSIGEMINYKEEDENVKLQNMICHELTHVYSKHLKLPMWLNEGLAMISSEKYIGKQTVKYETIEMLNNPPKKHKTGTYRNLSEMNDNTIAYHYARGYWLTRFLYEVHPLVLNTLMKKRHNHREIGRMIASALGVSRRKVWKEINDITISHFSAETCELRKA